MVTRTLDGVRSPFVLQSPHTDSVLAVVMGLYGGVSIYFLRFALY